MQIMFALPSRLVSPSSSVLTSQNSVIYLLILLTSVQLIDAFCDEHHWWQLQLNECIPCTVCASSESIVLRPCQLHADTVCGTLEDLEIELDWFKAAAIAGEQKYVSINLHFSIQEYLEQKEKLLYDMKLMLCLYFID